MITTTNLVMVRAYLKQELFPLFNEIEIEIEDNVIVIKLPNYDKVFDMVNQNVKGIKNRDYNLSFTVKGENQLRDFTILR